MLTGDTYAKDRMTGILTIKLNRLMYIDAEEKLKDLEQFNEMEGSVFKMTNDPRITSFGKFIRKTSIDELPQETSA